MNSDFINRIPKPILIIGVFLVGLGAIFLINPPGTICDAQFNTFTKSLGGQLFNKKGKPAIYKKTVQSCKLGNSSGACLEMFNVLRKILRELDNVPNQCGEESLEKKPQIKSVLKEGIILMALLAWGEAPPAGGGDGQFGFFEPSELAVFCNMQQQWIRLYGQVSYDGLRNTILNMLPGERKKFTEDQFNPECTNCDDIKKAIQLFSREELQAKSIFSVRCSQYR